MSGNNVCEWLLFNNLDYSNDGNQYFVDINIKTQEKIVELVEILDKNKVSYESKNQKLIFPVQNKVEELKEKINSKNTKDMQVLGDYYCKTKNNHEEMDKYLDKVINEPKLSPKEVDAASSGRPSFT